MAALSDGELLARFVADRGHRGEVAFAALVARHGPMVRAVCRRALLDPADADDAFQATFMVLVRRAAAIRVGDSLGRWLYGVSRRVSSRARTDRDRRRRRESSYRAVDRGSTPDQPGRSELLAALDDEVAHLPEPFRSAIFLCDLDGLTHEQAALALGCPVGTIKSRLARGRFRLRDRLVRRGLTDTLVVGVSAPISVPPRLLDATVRMAVNLVVAGPSIGPAVGAGWFLTKNGVLTMFSSLSFPYVAGSALMLALGTIGLNWSGDQDATKATETLPSGSASPAPRMAKDPGNLPRESSKVARPDYVVEPPDIIVVEVLKALPDRPITGERLVRPDGKISLGYYGEVYVAGLTTMEIKEKIIWTLRDYLDDEAVGLRVVKGDQVLTVAAAKSSKVFVDVVSFNSKVYYVQGEVKSPGRLPISGNETVLDAINHAGGIIPLEAPPKIIIIRPKRVGIPQDLIFPVDLEAITNAGDSTTNYQLMPGDRLVVSRASAPESSKAAANPIDPTKRIADLEARLKDVERQLDQVLKKLDRKDRSF